MSVTLKELVLTRGALLSVAASVVIVSGSMALAQGSPAPLRDSDGFATPKVERPGLDLVGVSLADLVRLYLSRLDAQRTYVACASLVSDTRLVSVRATRSLTIPAVVGLLRRHGYSLVEQDGVTFVCPANGERSSSTATFSAAAADSPASSPFAIEQADGGTPKQEAAPSTPLQELSAAKRTPFDRLVAAGWSYAGCVDSPSGIRVALKGSQGTLTFPKRDMDRSDASAFMRCRL